MLEQHRFEKLLGKTVIDLWSGLPQAVQEQIFERAVLLGHQTERDEMLREQLAKFLHDNHARTARSTSRLSDTTLLPPAGGTI